MIIHESTHSLVSVYSLTHDYNAQHGTGAGTNYELDGPATLRLHHGTDGRGISPDVRMPRQGDGCGDGRSYGCGAPEYDGPPLHGAGFTTSTFAPTGDGFGFGA